MFEDIGRAFCIGLLDYYNINPISRIPTSIYKTLDGVKDDLLARYPIFIPKPKKNDEDEGKPYTSFGRTRHAVNSTNKIGSLQRVPTTNSKF